MCQGKGTGPLHREASQLRRTTVVSTETSQVVLAAEHNCYEEEIDLSNSKGQQVFFGDNMATGEVCDG